MIELIETVCEKMSDYGTTTDPQTGRKGYTRINTRPGESLTITNVNLSSGGAEELTNAVRTCKPSGLANSHVRVKTACLDRSKWAVH